MKIELQSSFLLTAVVIEISLDIVCPDYASYCPKNSILSAVNNKGRTLHSPQVIRSFRLANWLGY